MKKTIILTLIGLSVVSVGRVYAQDGKETAAAKLELAIELMDQGHYDRSLALLDEADALYPDGAYIYSYERAYLYWLQEDYKTAIKLFKKCLKYDDVTDQAYQMLGNAYDMSGKPDKALAACAKGRKKFPNSGKLYWEAGLIYSNKREYGNALQYYMDGINADPRYPSNYYDATNLLLTTDDKAYGMICGEAFMCLEPNSRGSAIIGAKLLDAYRDNITFPNDTTAIANFSSHTISLTSDFKIPFPIIYEMAMKKAIGAVRTLDIPSLIEIRGRFVEIWFSEENKYNERYPSPLSDYHRALIETGHFEAYNYWLFSFGDPAAFEMWHLHNEEAFDAFVEWFDHNGILQQ